MLKLKNTLFLKKLILLVLFTFGCDSDPSKFVIVKFEDQPTDTEEDEENSSKNNEETEEDSSDKISTEDDGEEQNQADTDKDDDTEIDGGPYSIRGGTGNGDEEPDTEDDTTRNQTDDSLDSDKVSDSASDEDSEVMQPEDCDLVGVWGTRLNIEMMWGGHHGGLMDMTLDGRGDIEIYLRMTIDSLDPEDGSIDGTVRLCGADIPAFASGNPLCEAYKAVFPETLWESSSLPVIPFAAKRTCGEDGCTIDLDKIAYALGLSMNDMAEAPFPEPEEIETIECEAGVGKECFLDHDEDGRHGVMVDILTSGITNLPGYGCTNNNFRNMAAPLSNNPAVLVRDNWTARTNRLDLGIRVVFSASSDIDASCSTMSGIAQGCDIGLLSSGCMIKPGTRDIFTSPPAGNNQDCTETQSAYMNGNLPKLQFFEEGENPPEIIEQPDTSPSKGAQISLVKLGNLDDSVSCVDIRAVEY
jgi:hypothetical protein